MSKKISEYGAGPGYRRLEVATFA